MSESLEDEVRKYNEEQRLKGNSLGGKGGKQVSVHLDTNLKSETKQERDRSTNTREQMSKFTGVSTGNIARYDAVMKSDNEDLKQKVKSGEVKSGTAYKFIGMVLSQMDIIVISFAKNIILNLLLVLLVTKPKKKLWNGCLTFS